MGPFWLASGDPGGSGEGRSPRGAIQGARQRIMASCVAFEPVLKLRYWIHGLESRPVRVSALAPASAQHVFVTACDETNPRCRTRWGAPSGKNQAQRRPTVHGDRRDGVATQASPRSRLEMCPRNLRVSVARLGSCRRGADATSWWRGRCRGCGGERLRTARSSAPSPCRTIRRSVPAA
jgi:hypothetical protein